MSLEEERQRRLGAARRIVIKLGTSTVTGAQGDISRACVEPLAQSIAQLKSLGKQIVLVSSGAVGLGAGRLGLDRTRLRDVVMRQACAAVGQSLLMHAYERIFSEHRVQIAQVLLTEDDFTDWHRYLNLQRTIDKLLRLGVLPIINENDTVSVAELEYLAGAERVFSDNDRLAALVMSKLEADTLVLLTDVDGLLLMPDRKLSGEEERARELSAGAPKGAVIALVEEITPELKALATGPAAGGRGGMQTKLEAAQIAMRAGGIAVIANGHRPDTLTRIFAGEQIGTTFISTSRMAGKRRWIAYGASVRGRLIVNKGARDAITRGKASLLSSGVVRVEKQFAPHDVVSIADDEGREFARGIANCASEEAAQFIESHGSGEAAAVTAGDAAGSSSGNHRKPFVLVTRNNIVLLEKDE